MRKVGLMLDGRLTVEATPTLTLSRVPVRSSRRRLHPRDTDCPPLAALLPNCRRAMQQQQQQPVGPG